MSIKSLYKAKARGVNLIKTCPGPHFTPKSKGKKYIIICVKKIRSILRTSRFLIFFYPWNLSTGFVRFIQLEIEKKVREG